MQPSFPTCPNQSLPPLRSNRSQPTPLPQKPLDKNLHLLKNPPLPVRLAGTQIQNPIPPNPIPSPNTPTPHPPRQKRIRPNPIPHNRNLTRLPHHPPLNKPLDNLLLTERFLDRPRRQPEDGDGEILRRELGFQRGDLGVVFRMAPGSV